MLIVSDKRKANFITHQKIIGMPLQKGIVLQAKVLTEKILVEPLVTVQQALVLPVEVLLEGMEMVASVMDYQIYRHQKVRVRGEDLPIGLELVSLSSICTG